MGIFWFKIANTFSNHNIDPQVQQLTLDIETEKKEAGQAADSLAEWEEKVKMCKKTQSIISQVPILMIPIWARNVSG
jgi:archaellum component FlaC